MLKHRWARPLAAVGVGAVSLSGLAVWEAAATPEPGVAAALSFDGVNDYVALGNPASLGLATFTVETWFRRDGTGIATRTTSSGDVRGFSDPATDGVIPLVAKGRAQADKSNLDLNYILGIHTSGVLAADFEEGATSTPGRNHKILGATRLGMGVWYHAAVTYDGTDLKLYLDGKLERADSIGRPARSDSIQHASLASALNSYGKPAGYFAGALDEARVWNRALSSEEISNGMRSEVPNGNGLMARWGMNEAIGVVVGDATGAAHGTARNGPLWVDGRSFGPLNAAPRTPVLVGPADGTGDVGREAELSVRAEDPDGDPLDVAFFGRRAAGVPPGPFSIVVYPDTQYYSELYPDTYLAQANWVVDNREALDIRFVAHVGDIVDDWDTYESQWVNADAAHDVLDANDVPYGVVPGNHDITTTGVGSFYDTYFRPSRFAERPWYLGYLGDSLSGAAEGVGSDAVDDGGVDRLNKDSYQVVQVGTLRLVFIGLEYDMPGYALEWAQDVIDAQLAVDPTTEFVLVTHNFVNVSGVRPTSPIRRADGTSAEQVWNSLVKVNCSIHLVISGHYHGESRRRDLNTCGEPVHQLLADYQTRTNGGDGWLRYMTFRPADNQIDVRTYSPTLGRFETDANSQFTIDMDMVGATSGFQQIGTVEGVPSGGDASISWSGLEAGRDYVWYATSSDGVLATSSSTWSFATQPPPEP